jgi:hypothetical protein
MASKDHTVPQTYLKRFAERTRGGQFQLVAAPAEDLSTGFLSGVGNVAKLDGFYTETNDDGHESVELEQFFSKIEGLVTPVFARYLDAGPYAYPDPWPTAVAEDQTKMSWFLASQMLRTTRQRKRLAAMKGQGLPPPTALRDSELATEHGAFIRGQLGALASIIAARPWGYGFSAECLLTSDTPVVLMNDHDADDQLRAASFWEFVFPLDPHRFLFLPSVLMVTDDPAKRTDHRLFLDGWMGSALNQAIYDAADAYVFFHPKHRPATMPSASGRLPTPGSPEFGSAHEWFFSYEVLAADSTIERRYISDM